MRVNWLQISEALTLLLSSFCCFDLFVLVMSICFITVLSRERSARIPEGKHSPHSPPDAIATIYRAIYLARIDSNDNNISFNIDSNNIYIYIYIYI